MSLLRQKLVYLEVPAPELYRSSKYIEECNEVWDSTWAEHYIGSPSEIVTPGFIVPAKTLIIGEAEPDSPIALDYRTPGPRVVYMGDVDREVHWIELSPDYATFIRELE